MMVELCRIGRTAELRYAGNGEPVINLSLAYNYGRKGPDDRQPTQWVEAGLWGKRAEALAQYLVKGKEVFVTLEDVHIETFNKGDGSAGHKLAGRIQDIRFTHGDGQRDQPQQAAPASRAAPAARQPVKAKPAPPPNGSGFDDMSDDIPF